MYTTINVRPLLFHAVGNIITFLLLVITQFSQIYKFDDQTVLINC